ncbi:MAG: extracellular solute-binding protein [Gammaproteobacteria bacterium]|nr:extracellular solute-binding protein [Gammaproteobacteria bacterium]
MTESKLIYEKLAPCLPEYSQMDIDNFKSRAIKRRNLLKLAVALGAGSFFVPALSGSSGELNLFSWSDYIYPDMLTAFTKATGIKVKLSVYGSNDEALNKLRATQGSGFDLVMPSAVYGPIWNRYRLLQPIDESKVNVDGCNPIMWSKSRRLGAIYHRERYLCPFNWGTEALTWNQSERQLDYGVASYGDLWQPENVGKVTVRAHSALLAIGLYLDHIGELPSDKMRITYENENEMRRIYRYCTDFAVKHKPWIRQFWSNAQQIQNAFLRNACVIGQTWDGPAFRLSDTTKGNIRYMAPVEGALTWMDTMAIPKKARNVEQAYAFINWYYQPKSGAMHANNSGYNSCAKNVEQYLSENAQQHFRQAYPDDALENLWWYPPESSWFIATRNEFRDQYLAA